MNLNYFFLCALFFSTVAWASDKPPELPAQIAVSPPLLELALGNKPINQSLNLFNLGEEAVDVSVSVHNWDLDEDNEIRILPPEENSLDQWMIINPLRFKVAGGQSQTVRFSIRPRVQPHTGEYRAVIYFSQVPPENEENPGGMRVYFRIGAVIYALAGEISRHGVLHKLDSEQAGRTVTAKFDISSSGNANIRLNGKYALWPKMDFPGEPAAYAALAADTALDKALRQGVLPTRPVLPGTRRTLKLPLTVNGDGDYVLSIHGHLGETPFSKTLFINVPR
jgi:fimbrial chaperone protein